MFDSIMSNITLGIGDLIEEILEIESIEHSFPQVSQDVSIKILSWIIIALILISNGIFIYTISKKESKLTDLDKMMVFDSILCLHNSITIMMIGNMGTHNEASVCYVRYLWAYFNTSCDALLQVGVVVYRYVYVVKNSWIDEASRKKMFINTIYFSIVMLSGLITVATLYFRDDWIAFLSKSLNSIKQVEKFKSRSIKR